MITRADIDGTNALLDHARKLTGGTTLATRLQAVHDGALTAAPTVRQWCGEAASALTSVASDAELAQAYQQGYQDGRRGLETALKEIEHHCGQEGTRFICRNIARAALAKVAQEQEGKA